MPRTRVSRREAATPNGEQVEARPESSGPVLFVAEHPDVREAKAQLEDFEEKFAQAERRVSELVEQVETARSRFQAIRSRHILGEATDGEITEAQAALAGLERDFAAAQDWATGLRDTVEVLTRRAQDVETTAGPEVEAGLNERRRDLARRIAETLVAVVPDVHLLFKIEAAMRAQGFPIADNWSVAPFELAFVEGHRRIEDVGLAFGYHPADGTLLMEYLRRLRMIGVEVEPPAPVSLRDLLGREV